MRRVNGLKFILQQDDEHEHTVLTDGQFKKSVHSFYNLSQSNVIVDPVKINQKERPQIDVMGSNRSVH